MKETGNDKKCNLMGLKKGDILLIHSRSIIGWWIRTVTQSWWNHTAWVIDDGFNIIEAEYDVVRINPITRYQIGDRRKVRILRIDGIPEEILSDAVDLAVAKEGKIYDYKLFCNLLKLYIKNMREYIPAKDWNFALICSELIAESLYESAGFKFRDDIPVKNIVPADIDFSRHTYEVLQWQK